MVPWSEEKLLLQTQIAQNKSIFQCDGYAVYSNPVIQLAGVRTRPVDVDLHCPRVTVHADGEEQEALSNAHVFVKFWDQVISDGDFRYYDWTVKVDPDAVFLPDRLRKFVRADYHKEGPLGNGILFNNCKSGMLGSLEVMSSRALQVYAAGHGHCETLPEEDVYLQKCMAKLGVTEVDNFDLLADKACYKGEWHQSPDWNKCTGSNAAFHPFKSSEAYTLCLQVAFQHG